MDEFFQIMIVFVGVGLIMTIQSFRFMLERAGLLIALFSLFAWCVPMAGWLFMFYAAIMQTMEDLGMEPPL